MIFHKFHRISACIIGIFIFCHLINHLCIYSGVQQHIEVMEMLRIVYRNIFVESLLLFFVFFQASSGIYFVWKRRGERRLFFEKAQAISGLYLAFFFFNHIGAVLFGRIYVGLDTNIYFGIAGFHVNTFYLYFVPYYFLAVLSLFIHLASAFSWLSRKKITENLRMKVAYSIIGIGALLSFFLMLGFSGTFSEIQIPAEYRSLYE